jgi:hypothetical protein
MPMVAAGSPAAPTSSTGLATSWPAPYVGEDLVEIVIHEDPDGPLEVEQVANALNTAIESNTSFTFVDNLGDGESIVIDGTINIAVLTEELNKILAD